MVNITQKNKMRLRNYQIECLNQIEKAGKGKWIINLPVGSGKTVIFTSLPRKGKTLIIAHRDELIRQPIKYLDCPVGIEKGREVSNGEDVVIASIQSLQRRYKKFKPNEFHTIIYDEVHRIMGKQSLKVIDYFKPYQLLGFSASIERTDGVGLDNIFDKIIFQKDMESMIRDGYLCNINCLAVNVGYDLSKIKTKLGELDSKELDQELSQTKTVKATAEAYYKYAKGKTIIFACSIKHAESIAKEIKESIVISGKTKNRADLIEKFKNENQINCIISINVFVEGVDIPSIETVIFARPTLSKILYIQAIGRGMRLYPSKDELTLIDIVGNYGKHNICSAGTLLGIDSSAVPIERKEFVKGNIFDLPKIIEKESDTVFSWIKNTKHVELFARANKYILHDVSYFKYPDGSFVCHLPKKQWYKISPIDKTGWTYISAYNKELKKVKAQEAFNVIYKMLSKYHLDSKAIWDLKACKSWGRYQATDKQKLLVERFYPEVDVASLTKLQASQILNRRFMR